ncbi:hypothetical protein ACFTXJ_14510 [Streptomyces zhihengii]|uniref:hypothetical protein n=1 Tax=Streptomyces zhihengii TaxID=1818004 RepID=UPI003644288D
MPRPWDQRKHCGKCEEYSRTIIEQADEDDEELANKPDGKPRACPNCHPVMSFG